MNRTSEPEPGCAKRPVRVAVMGSGYWLDVVAELMRRAGVSCETVALERWDKVRWFCEGGWRHIDVVHLIGGVDWRMGGMLALVRKPVLIHWIGSDVLRLSAAVRGGVRGLPMRLCAFRWARTHLADSPALAEELRSLGVESQVVRLLPKLIEADIEPLPEKFTVLSYWFDDPGRRAFYGGDTVLQLAVEFPDIDFVILRATGRGAVPLPNVTYLGYRQDMAAIYSASSVLIRLPKHDSLSTMVLEMLARGRYVIYNSPLDGVHHATTLAEARATLRDILERREPNTRGARMVRREFSLDREAEALAHIYRGRWYDPI